MADSQFSFAKAIEEYMDQCQTVSWHFARATANELGQLARFNETYGVDPWVCPQERIAIGVDVGELNVFLGLV